MIEKLPQMELLKEKGLALEKFEEMVTAHGGDLESFDRFCAKPTFKFKIQAMRSGYVTAIDAEKVARAAFMLGAGHVTAGDRIDPLAGITLAVKVGDKVAVGAPLATLEKSTEPDGLDRAAADSAADAAVFGYEHSGPGASRRGSGGRDNRDKHKVLAAVEQAGNLSEHLSHCIISFRQ